MHIIFDFFFFIFISITSKCVQCLPKLFTFSYFSILCTEIEFFEYVACYYAANPPQNNGQSYSTIEQKYKQKISQINNDIHATYLYAECRRNTIFKLYCYRWKQTIKTKNIHRIFNCFRDRFWIRVFCTMCR